MKKRTIELINSIVLVLFGIIVLALPLFDNNDIELVFILMFSIFGFISLYKFILVYKTKDYDGLFTFIACILGLVLVYILDLEKPFHLALLIMLWVIVMSLIKLKKSDYYHDRKSKEWLIKFITMILFISTGIICAINLNEPNEQMLVVGFFFYIHGILELMEPISLYLLKNKEV